MPRSIARVAPWLLLFGVAPAAADVSFERERTVTLTQPDAGAANEAGDYFGAVLAAGDLDADGDDDLVVGAPLEDSAADEQGAIFVYPGGEDPSGFFADATFYFSSMTQRSGVATVPGASDDFGAALAIGNFDADDERELVVAAPGFGGGAGAVFVFQGGGAEAIVAPGVRYDASHFGCGTPTAGDLFGAALAAGDANGDGYDDLAIGVPGAGTAAGKVCLVPGGFSGLADGTGFAYFQNTNDYTPSIVEAGDRFGAALAFGHFTDDDFADLAIGTPGEAPSADPAGGTTAVWFGKDASTIADFFASGIALSEAGVSPVQTIQAGDEFGAALAVIPMPVVTDRLVVGAPGESSGTGFGIAIEYSPDPSEVSFGWVRDQTTFASAPGDAAAGDDYGRSFAVVDLDGNGSNELLIGAPGEDGGDGMVMLWTDVALAGFALAQPFDVHDFLLLNGVPHDDIGFGTAMASGDFDGDGRFELAIGAPRELAFGVSAGVVYVVPEPGASAAALAAAFALVSAGSRRRRSSSRSR
jgi:hypothetical protein